MRVKSSVQKRKAMKRLLKLAEGYRGGRHRLNRTVQEAVERGMRFATHGKKRKKRDFRQLWISRVRAAAELHGMNYHEIIDGLIKAKVALNRKMLSEVAIHDPAAFGKIAELARGARGAKAA